VTKERRWIEYEIKRSKADFLKDRSKVRWWKGEPQNKHELLASSTDRGPSMFYFVLPVELDVNVPEWAGIVRTRFVSRLGQWSVWVERKAPKRHNRQEPDDVVHAIWRTAYYRLSNSWTGLLEPSCMDGDGI
jgi:hypothetical protein